MFAEIERRTAPEVLFSHAGALTATTSPRWYSRHGGRLVKVVVSLATAGTSTTTVTIYRNDVSVGTVDLLSGEQYKTLTLNVALVADVDHLRVGVTTVGTGAKDINVQGWLA